MQGKGKNRLDCGRKKIKFLLKNTVKKGQIVLIQVEGKKNRSENTGKKSYFKKKK